MSVVDVEMREPRTGALVQLKVIGVLDRLLENSGSMIVSKSILDNAVPFVVPITNYRFRLADGVDAKETAMSMEALFLEHGVDTKVLEEELEKEAAGAKTFFRLFIGFMGLGLLVGVAGLGVITTRAVVERRQQIGVLRAIGYRRRMIQLSFLLESSFVSLLGIVIGTTLGIVLGWQAYNDIKAGRGHRHHTVRHSLDPDRRHSGADLRGLAAGDLPPCSASLQGLPGRGPSLRVEAKMSRINRGTGLNRGTGSSESSCHSQGRPPS